MMFWEKLKVRGFACSHDTAAPSYNDLAKELERRCGLVAVGRTASLKPKSQDDASPQTMSSIYGLLQQPFHTDCASWPRPPRMISLHCIEGGIEEVSTDILVFDWQAVDRIVADDLKETVQSFQCHRKRAVYGAILQRLPDIGWRVRFDPTLLPLTCKGLEEKLCSLGQKESIVLESGHWLIIDNFRTLHRRSKVLESTNRLLQRRYWGVKYGMGI